MALDNQLGRVFVGQEVPFITSSTPNTLTGLPINSITREQVGLNLLVTPRISPDGLIVMSVFASNERLRPLIEGVPVAISPNGVPINSPIVDSIQAETTVSAVSGQTVVISSLLTKEDRALQRRVPILANIPLLRKLFQFDSVSTERKELLIVLTPHIVNNCFEAEMLKQVESAQMSWCLSDVVDLHGPAGLRSRGDHAGVAEAETVYPDQIVPEELMPTPSYEEVPDSEFSEPDAPPQVKKTGLRFPWPVGGGSDDTTSTK